MSHYVKSLFMYSASYTYSNLSRLFIRLFVGVMFLQFGIRQIVKFSDIAANFPTVFGMSSTATLIVMIIIEMGCAAMIMSGFLTRLACVPAFISMAVAVDRLLLGIPFEAVSELSYLQPIYLPIMFGGIFIYLLLAGPGKISFDYLISLHLINKNKAFEDDDKLTEA